MPLEFHPVSKTALPASTGSRRAALFGSCALVYLQGGKGPKLFCIIDLMPLAYRVCGGRELHKGTEQKNPHDVKDSALGTFKPTVHMQISPLRNTGLDLLFGDNNVIYRPAFCSYGMHINARETQSSTGLMMHILWLLRCKFISLMGHSLNRGEGNAKSCSCAVAIVIPERAKPGMKYSGEIFIQLMFKLNVDFIY